MLPADTKTESHQIRPEARCPEIALVTPVFNPGKYIDQTIQLVGVSHWLRSETPPSPSEVGKTARDASWFPFLPSAFS
jgi:hypothetical protein